MHAGMLSEPDLYVGWWTNKGRIYFDVSRVHTHEHHARSEAKRLNEMAYWDVQNKTGTFV